LTVLPEDSAFDFRVQIELARFQPPPPSALGNPLLRVSHDSEWTTGFDRVLDHLQKGRPNAAEDAKVMLAPCLAGVAASFNKQHEGRLHLLARVEYLALAVAAAYIGPAFAAFVREHAKGGAVIEIHDYGIESRVSCFSELPATVRTLASLLLRMLGIDALFSKLYGRSRPLGVHFTPVALLSWGLAYGVVLRKEAALSAETDPVRRAIARSGALGPFDPLVFAIPGESAAAALTLAPTEPLRVSIVRNATRWKWITLRNITGWLCKRGSVGDLARNVSMLSELLSDTMTLIRLELVVYGNDFYSPSGRRVPLGVSSKRIGAPSLGVLGGDNQANDTIDALPDVPRVVLSKESEYARMGMGVYGN
jgi:hypothetical protein